MSDQATIAQALVQLGELIKSIKESGDATTQALLAQQAEALAREMPMRAHPGKSAYSYPEGDLARPKPSLKCQFFWVGFPETVETLRPDEIDALNSLQPGEYWVMKANGVRIKFTVEGKVTASGQLESLSVYFPCKGDQMFDHDSKISYCRQAMGMPIRSLEELRADLAQLQRDLARSEATPSATAPEVVA